VILSGADGESTGRASEALVIGVGRSYSRKASWTQENEVKRRKENGRKEKRRGRGGRERVGEAVAVPMLSMSNVNVKRAVQRSNGTNQRSGQYLGAALMR
jgi:hypothetical protein